MRSYPGITALGLLLAAAGAPVLAQVNNNPVTTLENVTAVTCAFPVSSQVVWAKDGTPTVKTRDTSGPTLTVKVAKIDAQGGTGEFTAPANAEAVVQQYGWNMHIMEPSRAGRMMLLTVFGRESREKKLKAVYSRSDYLPVDLPGFISEPEAAQYYGECEVTR